MSRPPLADMAPHCTQLGALAYSEKYATSPFDHRGEEWLRDALWNPVWHATYGAIGAPQPQLMTYDNLHGGQLLTEATGNYICCSATVWPDSTAYSYDGDKNLHYRRQYQMLAGSGGATVVSWVNERHYYGADDRLRVVERAALGQFNTANLGYLSAPSNGVWEEYRYDALGRRVLVRARRDDLSSDAYAHSTLDRVIWDGDRILYELRAPGGPSDNLDSYAWGTPNPPYGKVGYLHGRDLDEPLALLDKRVPLRTWRGAGVSSVWTTGQAADCSRTNPCDGVNVINWPETRWSDDMAPWASSGGASNYLYVGSLLMGSQDGTGMLYRRNRYYDPQSARFTQIDPIGIAGGVNVYGFAGGDPVSYTDPFGLCPPIEDCLQQIADWGWAHKGLVGNIALNGAAALNAVNQFDPVSNAFDLGWRIGCSVSNCSSGADDKPQPPEEPKGGHRDNPRESTRERHEKADARRRQDQRKTEKGDARRPYRKSGSGAGNGLDEPDQISSISPVLSGHGATLGHGMTYDSLENIVHLA